MLHVNTPPFRKPALLTTLSSILSCESAAECHNTEQYSYYHLCYTLSGRIGYELWQVTIIGTKLWQVTIIGTQLWQVTIIGTQLWQVTIIGTQLWQVTIIGTQLWQVTIIGTQLWCDHLYNEPAVCS